MLFSRILRLRVLALVLLIVALSAIYYAIFLVYGSNSDTGASVVDKVVVDLPYDATKGNRRIGVYVDVYYESLCPDSRSFFMNELLPTVHKLGDVLFVNLVPYGRAETIIKGEDIEFICQHGPKECLGNKFHACIIQNTKSNNQLSVNVTGCLFEDYFQPQAERCCKKFGVPWEDVKSCVYGSEGTQLLKVHGDLTNRLLPIDFIPTVALNQVTGSKNYQAAILKNLANEVCRILERSSINLSACQT
ncbi:gamma-interferon inducible lysosomal thiol reductase [Nesidiocoris tenuis]|uniref:Gamma-interferon inducible lysosomal thiol reductase n=1 Tax=Nesidiocoris tenuis TaxID=355587 RepID=A0ABN7ADC1_9HEMI|nr:gamma-interferon inducible lysosomal thiol reductase [Nesidiocoris tenuis]